MGGPRTWTRTTPTPGGGASVLVAITFALGHAGMALSASLTTPVKAALTTPLRHRPKALSFMLQTQKTILVLLGTFGWCGKVFRSAHMQIRRYTDVQACECMHM